jgi:hypothetical protein
MRVSIKRVKEEIGVFGNGYMLFYCNCILFSQPVFFLFAPVPDDKVNAVHNFLGAFTQLRKVAIISAMFVLLHGTFQLLLDGFL